MSMGGKRGDYIVVYSVWVIVNSLRENVFRMRYHQFENANFIGDVNVYNHGTLGKFAHGAVHRLLVQRVHHVDATTVN